MIYHVKGELSKHSIKFQITSDVCVMVVERDFKAVTCYLATLASRSKLLSEPARNVILFP